MIDDHRGELVDSGALQAVLDDRLVGRNLFKKQLPGIWPREKPVQQDCGAAVVKQQC